MGSKRIWNQNGFGIKILFLGQNTVLRSKSHLESNPNPISESKFYFGVKMDFGSKFHLESKSTLESFNLDQNYIWVKIPFWIKNLFQQRFNVGPNSILKSQKLSVCFCISNLHGYPVKMVLWNVLVSKVKGISVRNAFHYGTALASPSCGDLEFLAIHL